MLALGEAMRIAFCGSHRTGKSTLVEALAAVLPGYAAVDEPYHAMVEGGYEFNHPPSLEDFEAQLAHSIESLAEGERDVLLDRCPLDFLAYIAADEAADEFDFEEWLPRVRAAVGSLDLIVFVPIEAPDRIVFAASDDDGESRALVDEKLREILIEDSFELGVNALEVEGSVETRVESVLKAIPRRR